MAQVIKLKSSSGTTLPSSLEYGELGVMYKSGSEKIVFKNSDGTIGAINEWSKILNKPNLATLDTAQTFTGKKVFQNVDGVVLSNGTNTVTLSIDSNGRLKVDGDIYSTGEVSAYGSGTGTGGGGGLISTVFDSTGLGGTYLDTDYSNTFNAYTINKINNDLNSSLQRISSLEGGSATSISSTGTGNVVTNISKSGSTLNITKASTAILEGDSRLTD